MRLRSAFLLILLVSCGACSHAGKAPLKSTSEKLGSRASRKPYERFLKRKVAIARFSNETLYGRKSFLGKKKYYSKQAVDILSARLASTNKFILLERIDADNIIGESIRRLQNENAAANKKYKASFPFWHKEDIGEKMPGAAASPKFRKEKKKKEENSLYYKNLILSPSKEVLLKSIARNFRGHVPADYLIFGSISEFGRKVVGSVGLFSRSKKQVVRAAVNIRLVDASTGQIVYAEEESGEVFSKVDTFLGIGDRAGYDASLNDKAMSAAISKLVKNIVKHILDKPWRAYILAHEGSSYIMSGGRSQGIRVGDTFGAYNSGKKVINPQTGLPIELPGKLLGRIRVDKMLGSTIRNEVSLCSVISGSLPKNDFSGLYIQELSESQNKHIDAQMHTQNKVRSRTGKR